MIADFLNALQFLTRIPVPALPGSTWADDSLSRAAKFFPVVGLLVGGLAALLHFLLVPHLPRLAAAALTITFVVLLTGAFHEDGLADTADGLGGGWSRAQVLTILRDSRIGSYGGAALALSLIARITLLAALPLNRVAPTLLAAHMLCRWTTLPMAAFLPSARPPGDGQATQLAVSRPSLAGNTAFVLVCAIVLLRWRALPALLLACVVTLLSGLYYRHRIGGVTGDCLGATNQLAEISTLLTGAWTL